MKFFIKKFKLLFQFLSTIIVILLWVSLAISDIVNPSDNYNSEDNLRFITSTGRAILNAPEETDLARRKALEDALYLASLEGGAKIDGYTAIDSGTNLTENFIVRPTTKILDYAIVREVIKETHYEVTIKAAVGNLKTKNCKNNSILNVIAYKPILSLSNDAPAWLSAVLSDLYKELISDISKRKRIQLSEAFDTELNANQLKNINDDYDYTSLTSGRIRTEIGSFAYVPSIEMFIDTKSSPLNNETFLIMKITSDLYEGFTYIKSSTKSHKISLKLGNKSPWKTVNILSKPSKKLIVEALQKAVEKHIDALFLELDCQPLKANLRFNKQDKILNVNLGKKHGVTFNSIAFTRGTNTPWVIFKVDDLGNNTSILSPIDPRRDLNELDGKIVEFMEVL